MAAAWLDRVEFGGRQPLKVDVRDARRGQSFWPPSDAKQIRYKVKDGHRLIELEDAEKPENARPVRRQLTIASKPKKTPISKKSKTRGTE
jgi:hypothetical protein